MLFIIDFLLENKYFNNKFVSNPYYILYKYKYCLEKNTMMNNIKIIWTIK